MPPWENFFLSSSGLSEMVPALGLGMRPLGPKSLANLASLGMILGSAIRTSKSILSALSLARVLSEAISTFWVLPVP